MTGAQMSAEASLVIITTTADSCAGLVAARALTKSCLLLIDHVSVL